MNGQELTKKKSRTLVTREITEVFTALRIETQEQRDQIVRLGEVLQFPAEQKVGFCTRLSCSSGSSIG